MREYCQIELNGGSVAQVSAEDFEELSRYKWRTLVAGRTIYARRHEMHGKSTKTILMHREIMKADPIEEIDHVDGDGLDNRRHKLRRVTHQQNCFNTRTRSNNSSGYKGVCWDKANKKWMVCITANGKAVARLRVVNILDAAQIYVLLSYVHHGEYSRAA